VKHASSVVNTTLKEHSAEATIGLTVCATSAAPTYFPEVKWNNLVFWDGGLLNNNPIDQLWAARYDLVEPSDPEPKVSCVLSLGCGHVKAGAPSDSWFQLSSTVASVIGFATNTEAKGKDFSRHISNLNRRPYYADTRYFRFNVNMRDQEIGLADYKRMNELKDLTAAYLREDRQQKWIDDCVNALAV
jgi:predicted acylesterase/phospholipase RssA